jgi:hypothetical protein
MQFLFTFGFTLEKQEYGKKRQIMSNKQSENDICTAILTLTMFQYLFRWFSEFKTAFVQWLTFLIKVHVTC